MDLIIREGVKASSFQLVCLTKIFPNHDSIFTGLYTENHGIIFNEFHDPYTNTHYKIWDTIEVRNSRWYHGESTWKTLKPAFCFVGSVITLIIPPTAGVANVVAPRPLCI